MISIPKPPCTISPEEHPYFEKGFRSGSIPRYPFTPRPYWTGNQLEAYAVGFDLGMDALADTMSAN